jgi:hypothetical protein
LGVSSLDLGHSIILSGLFFALAHRLQSAIAHHNLRQR